MTHKNWDFLEIETDNDPDSDDDVDDDNDEKYGRVVLRKENGESEEGDDNCNQREEGEKDPESMMMIMKDTNRNGLRGDDGHRSFSTMHISSITNDNGNSNDGGKIRIRRSSFSCPCPCSCSPLPLSNNPSGCGGIGTISCLCPPSFIRYFGGDEKFWGASATIKMLLLCRGLLGFVGIGFALLAIQCCLPLGDANALIMTSPIIASVLAAVFLGEK